MTEDDRDSGEWFMPEQHERCPKCGGVLTFGYGLCGGGIGGYEMCLHCDYFKKERESDEERTCFHAN